MSNFLHGHLPRNICVMLDDYLQHELQYENDDDVEQLPRPMFTRAYSGHQYVKDLLEGHPQRVYNSFRMSAETFLRLKNLLQERALLGETRNMTVEEQLAIFLRGVAHAQSYRQLCEFFQHSLETVSRYFNKVLQAVASLSTEFIRLPDGSEDVCHSSISSNPIFYPYFKNVLGAIDGTHIPCTVSRDDQNRYRNRKGFTSQNVLAAVSFDRQFLYVAAGWEGSAADMRVLRWAVDEDGFVVPNSKYYLVDSGYANTEKFLAPFRGNRYHLSNYQGVGRQRYEGPKELFNHRHAQLRNVVERTFGIWKERFQILTRMRKFPVDIQTDIVVACAVLHNFVARNNVNDQFFSMSTTEMEHDPNIGEVPSNGEDRNLHASIGERGRGDLVRDAIANELWGSRPR